MDQGIFSGFLAAAAKASGAASDNLWDSILQDVVQRDEHQDSCLLLLGNFGVGKRSIVREINTKYAQARNKNLNVDEMGSDYAALSSSFLYVKDLMET